MEIKVFNIEWETDGENVSLPSEMIIDIEPDDPNDDLEIEFLLIDAISDETGWLHNGFKWQRL